MPDIDHGTYVCRECAQEIDADLFPSPCELHRTCEHCAQWCPCALDRAEELGMDEIRGAA